MTQRFDYEPHNDRYRVFDRTAAGGGSTDLALCWDRKTAELIVAALRQEEQRKRGKPTVHELEEILKQENLEIKVNPDGSIRAE